jgi:LCP family protein required for cell wall assembly
LSAAPPDGGPPPGGDGEERPPEQTDEHFEGIPPEQLPPQGPLPESDEIPELEPELREALRQAAGTSPSESAAETEQGGHHPAAPGGAAEEAASSGETIEYAPGEAPDEQGPEQEPEPEGDGAGSVPPPVPAEQHTEEQPVRTVVIGAPAEQAREAVESAAETGRPWAPPRPPAGGDAEQPPKPRRYWWRFLLASFLIIASVAAATATSILLVFQDLADKLQENALGEGVTKQLFPVPAGGPETFLILGSDKRASDKGDPGRSDTTILLRLDPDQHRVALMSIPRDLKVYIPGFGTDKFNAAYTYGGPKLTLRTIRRLMPGLHINHVVNVDFLGFVRAIDAIGCVWGDVDRRYYHSNAGLPPSLQYSEINIAAGYQRLCGKDALAFVRYRHTDTDLVRSARQQDFLREARSRVPISKFIDPGERNKLLDIFTTYTSSDVDSVSTMLEIMHLLFDSRGSAIKEIHFPAVLGPSYVYASKSAISGAVNQFLGFQASGGPRGALDLQGTGGGKQGGGGSKKKKAPKAEHAPPTPTPQSDGLVDAAAFSKQMGKTVARKVGADFHVFYPRRLPSATIYVQRPRVYHLNDTSENKHEAYRMVLQIPQGDYFGVQGIRGWDDPPILDEPSESRTIKGRQYDIYLDGDRVRLIAWHDGGNSYWISNSLLQTLTNDQVLGMARSVGELSPHPKKHPKKHGKKK